MRLCSRRGGRVLLRAALAALVTSAAAHATTFVRMGERALVAASVGAVRGRVSRIESGADPDTGALYTYVWIEPAQRLFGALPAGTLVLRELGGRVRGREQRLFGAPEYEVGESVLVFVSRHRDGTLHTTGLGLGKYRIAGRAGSERALRRSSADVFDPQTGSVQPDMADDVALSDLLARVHDALAAGTAPASGHVLSRPADLRVVLEPRPAFKLLNPNVRWFEADAGMPIGYLVDATGDVTIGAPATRAAVDAGIAVWSAVPDIHIELADAGDSEPQPLSGCEDLNRIVFNDPFGEVDPPAECEGVLAVTFVCDGDETRVVNGRTYRRIHGAKTTVNDGFGACPFWTPCNVAQVVTHELGHTFGLGHSEFPIATMAARVQFDGRCAGLTSDDEAAIRFVYPLLPATPTATPTPSATVPPAPSATVTRTGTATRTGSITRTPTRTATRTRAATATRTPTPTHTRVPSRTATASPTLSASLTPSASATPSTTPSPSRSATQTSTTSPTASSSPSATASATPTPPARPDEWLASLVRAVERLRTLLAALRSGK